MPGVLLLDCTFRDGGYYNSWDFSPELVASYLDAMASAGIPYVELGFRSPAQDGYLGAHAYTTDDFVSGLKLPKGPTYGVMINAKEFLGTPEGPEKAIDALFAKRKDSKIGLVRIACHFAESALARPLAARLKALGYEVGFNLMQAGGKPAAQLTKAAADISSWKCVDVLYFADSLGNMDPETTRETVAALKKGWSGPLGVHTHDNRGYAMANSAAAVEAGATWVDGTVGGMGRGAGNAHTEYLLVDAVKRGWGKFDPEKIFRLALGEFEDLRKRYGWGPNLLYYLSAEYGIHPTYVQEMQGKGSYSQHEILSALEFLKSAGAAGYHENRLQEAVAGEYNGAKGKWSAAGFAKGRPVLVVAAGPGTKRHLDALVRYVERRKPVVLCLNTSDVFPAEKVTAYAACHKASLAMDAEHYSGLKKPVIMPVASVPAPVRDQLKGVKVLDYGMGVERETFRADETGCVIPSPLVAAYALALAEAGGASRVLLAGFDGYPPTDPRHHEMSHVLRRYAARPTAVPLTAVTPTAYEIEQDSIYSPSL